MGYTDWRNFTRVLDRARNTAENLNMDMSSAFVGVNNRVPAGDGWTDRTDCHLSRFAAYLVAMNGDPRKPQVATAQGPGTTVNVGLDVEENFLGNQEVPAGDRPDQPLLGQPRTGVLAGHPGCRHRHTP